MIRFPRTLATRLRRLAMSSPPRAPERAAVHDAWRRLECALATEAQAPSAIRQRELSGENVRLAVTLIGQQGRRAVGRVVAAGNGDRGESNEGVRVALAVARALGHGVEGRPRREGGRTG